MKRLILTLGCLSFFTFSFGQFVATMEVKEPIDGLCNQELVYAIFPGFSGQQEAQCKLTKDEILALLNAKVQFLKDNPKFKSKGMMSIIVNCNGEIVKSEMDNKTTNEELDGQIEDVFRSLGQFAPATLNGKKVDSVLLYSLKVKKGKIFWD